MEGVKESYSLDWRSGAAAVAVAGGKEGGAY